MRGAGRALELVETDVVRDAVEPRPKLRLAAKAREGAERLQIRLLKSVVHTVAIPEQPVGEGAQASVVVSDHSREGLLVSAPGAVDDRGSDLGRRRRDKCVHRYLDGRGSAILHARGVRTTGIRTW